MKGGTHLKIIAEIPNNSYLGIGFGPHMTGTDMVMFFAKGTGSSVGDYYSSGLSKPTLDTL